MKALSSDLSLKGAFFYEFQETKMKKIKKTWSKIGKSCMMVVQSSSLCQEVGVMTHVHGRICT